jgi:hypothetical protein
VAAPDRRDLATKTLTDYLKTGEESLAHTIVENGADFTGALKARFEADRSEDVKLSIILLAREIRTEESADFLVKASLSWGKRIWDAALGGLAYQQVGDVLNRLRELSKSLTLPDQAVQRAYIDDLIRSASGWISRESARRASWLSDEEVE